jgi:hypothetical protein
MIDVDQNILNKCACKGIRKCAICSPNATKCLDDILPNKNTYIYCQKCQKNTFLNEKSLLDIKFFFGKNQQTECFCSSNDEMKYESININGIFTKFDFICYEEENYLIDQINNFNWNESQSGQISFQNYTSINLFF